MKIFILHTTIVAFLNLAPLLYAGDKIDSKVTITDNLQGRITEVSSFDCDKKVFAYVRLNNLQTGRHLAEAYWFSPDRRQRDYSQYEFHSNDSFIVWFSVKISRGFGGKFFKRMDPQAGCEEFLGQWRVVIYLDGKKLDEKIYVVL